MFLIDFLQWQNAIHAMKIQKKDVILLVASEGDTEDNFKPLKDCYLALLDKLGWKNLGNICAGGNVAIGDITNKVEQLNSAYEL